MDVKLIEYKKLLIELYDTYIPKADYLSLPYPEACTKQINTNLNL